MANENADHVTREIPALFMRAEFQPKTCDPEKRTAEVVFSTGARVLRGGWWSDPYWEELSLEPKHVRMGRLMNGAPLLAAHNGYDLESVLGVVESASVDGKRGTAIVRFARDAKSEEVFRKVQDGILQNISVGYRVHKLETTDKGDPEAKKWPVRLATDWEPYEISVVPMGADDGAGFRGADRNAPNLCSITGATPKETRTMADPNVTPTPTDPKADPTEALLAQAKAENARASAETDKAAREAADKAATEARERITETMKLVRKTNLGDAFAERLIKANTPLDKVREIVLRELTESQEDVDGHVRFEAGDDARDKFIRGAAASIFERSGHAQMLESAKKNERVGHLLKDVSLDGGGEYRGMRLIDLARASLEMRGISTKGLHGERLVQRALQYRGDSGFNTTSDFAILLETAVNKVFVGQYALTPVTWPRWCGRKSVQDFRTSTFYRPGTFGVLDSVTESGEIKHKNIPDGEKSTITPATKGNIIGISRRAIVNDDLGAFRDLASGLGMAAALSVETDAFALVTANAGLGPTQADGQALFHANRSNIGTAGAMSVATWDGSAAVMAAQKDVSKNQILDLQPAVLLCPRSLGLTAKQINSSAADPTASKNANIANPVANMVRDIVATARLPGAGGTTTRHYFLADPGMYPVFAVGFIDGQEAPRIESEQSFEYDGVQMRVILDYGTAVLDYRGAVATPGV